MSTAPALARTALRRLGESDHQIESLLEDHRRVDLSAAEVALLDFCLKLAFHALSVSSSDIDQLRQHGIDDESIIEAVVTMSLAIYRCTLSAGLHPEPDHEPWKLPPEGGSLRSAAQSPSSSHATSHRPLRPRPLSQSANISALRHAREKSWVHPQFLSRSNPAARLAHRRGGACGRRFCFPKIR